MLGEAVLKKNYPNRKFSPFIETNFIKVNGINTRYGIKGEGAPILFLHGFPENLQTWRHYFGILSDSFKTIALDLKGFGYTDKPDCDYTLWNMVDFVKGFMDALEIEKFNLAGSDIGMAIAAAYAHKYSAHIDKLILMAGSVYGEGFLGPEVTLLSKKPLGEIIMGLSGSFGIKMGLEKGFYGKDFISEELFKEYYTPYKEFRTKKITLDFMRSFATAKPDMSKEITNLQPDTLILWAQYEKFFTMDVAKWLNRDIKNSRLEIVPDCGHFIQEEKPLESADIIRNFISK
ncbi:alpha/beta fold hydrolase [Candidatus Omnitrophota bacterium]